MTTPNKNAHTPGKCSVSTCYQCLIVDHIGKEIALTNVRYREGDENLANAQRMALCWNTHDALLAALKRILKISKSGVVTRHESGKPTWCANEEVAKIAQSAIEALKGE